MLDFILAVFAFAATTQPGAPADAPTAAQALAEQAIPEGLTAEPQTPTGKFTTAVEVKPILTATKANWIALRDYDGQDLLYVTHLWSWRCGLSSMRYSVNDGPMQDWPLPPCHSDTAAPNAITPADGVPYVRLPKGSVHKVDVQIVYDDLSTDSAAFDRTSIMMP